MKTITGIFAKVGKVIGGVVHGDSVVQATVRLCTYQQAVAKSLADLEVPETLGNLLAYLTGQCDLSFLTAAEYIGEVKTKLQTEKVSQDSNCSYKAVMVVVKGGTTATPLYLYNGGDPTKEGRLYVKGVILKQTELIPATNPKPEPDLSDEFYYCQAIRKMLDVGKYGQFMLPNDTHVSYLRVVDEK